MLEAGARLQEVLEEIQARQTGNQVLAADDSSDAPFNDPWETF
jgi:hypothetical protein